MPHRALVFPAKNQRTFPETEDAVLLERRHETNDSVAFEKRRLPLDRFFDIRTADVHDFAQMFQDRPGKWRGALNVIVDSRIFFGHRSYSVSRGC